MTEVRTQAELVAPMQSYWASIQLPGKLKAKFEYHGPWWISGESGAEDPDDETGETPLYYTLCAWVMATDEDAAIETLRLAIDADCRPEAVTPRFSSQRERDDSDRFGAKDWMRWPWPVKPLEPRP